MHSTNIFDLLCARVGNGPGVTHPNKIVWPGLFLVSQTSFYGPLFLSTASLLCTGSLAGVPRTGHSKLGISLSPFIPMEFRESREPKKKKKFLFWLLQIIPHRLLLSLKAPTLHSD